MMNEQKYQRYHRQIILKGFGIVGQNKLLNARVLMVGAGGLGCPVLQYLAAAGVGHLGIIDDGRVELSNLHRQVLYTVRDVGSLKVSCARDALKAMNPDINILTYPYRLDNTNVLDLIEQYDVVIDGTDNFSSKYMISDACYLQNKTLIHGSISRYEGQVAIFQQGITYRDIFPEAPHDGEILNCSEAGVLGILPGIIGNFMANECVKFIAGLGETLINQLLTYNALNNTVYTISVTKNPSALLSVPKTKEAFLKKEYALLASCATVVREINSEEFSCLSRTENVDIIDVRERSELPRLQHINHLSIPLSIFDDQLQQIKKSTVIFVCQSGKRSLLAASKFLASRASPEMKIYSLSGGVPALKHKL